MHRAAREGQGRWGWEGRGETRERLSFPGTCLPDPERLQIRLFARETRDVANYYSSGHSPFRPSRRGPGRGKRGKRVSLSRHPSVLSLRNLGVTQYCATTRSIRNIAQQLATTCVYVLYERLMRKSSYSIYIAVVYSALVKKGKGGGYLTFRVIIQP